MNLFRICFVLALMAMPVAADELRTLTGKNFSGAFDKLTDSELTLKTDKGDISTPVPQVLALNLRPAKGIPEGSKSILVRLLDDAALQCKDVTFNAKEATLTLFSGATLKLPLNLIVSYTREGQNKSLLKKFDEVAGKKARKDRIVILREGELNILEGLLGDIDPAGKSIQFRPDGAPSMVDLPFERLHGFVFFRNESVAGEPICRVSDIDGNTMIAAKLTGDSQSLTLTTLFGAKVALKTENLSKLDFNLGRLTYLSDLEPAKVVERSGIGLLVRLKRDTNLDGDPIVLDAKYAKGLSLHAFTDIEYNLGGKYKEFKTVLGVDTRTGADSQPLVTIYCDGEKRFSETITAKQPRPIAINVKDVGTLRIVVSSRNFLDLHDHVTLADARVSQ